jgi:hypothetical protein
MGVREVVRLGLGWVLVAGWALAVEAQLPPVRVSSGTMAGLQISRALPDYPDEVLAGGISGAPVARVMISESGHVEKVEVISGPEAMRPAFVDAVRHWVYRPYLVDGVPRKVETVITMWMQYGGGPFCGGSLVPGVPDYHLRVSSGAMAGRLLSRPDPVFAPFPPGAHVSGATVMRVCISREGKVERVMAIAGPEALRSTVVETVKRWTYKSYVVDGKAVPVTTTVTINLDFGGGEASAPSASTRPE